MSVYRTADELERALRPVNVFRSGPTRPTAPSFRKSATPTRPTASTARPVSPRVAPAPFVATRPFNAEKTVPTQRFAEMLSRAESRLQPSTKVGPRGATLEAVQAVASGNVPVITNTANRPLPPREPINQEELRAQMFGGPAPGYGQKYGGYPTASYFENAVRGEAMNILAAQQEVNAEAERQAQAIDEQYAFDMDPTRGGVLGRKLQENRRIASTPLQELASEMAGGTPGYWDLYGANMARMNAARGAVGGTVVDETTGQRRPATMADNARAMVQQELDQRRERDLRLFGVSRVQDIADSMAMYTPSELMQIIAVEKYGYDPALAAGLFPVSEDLDYQQTLQEARIADAIRQGATDPNSTVAETILDRYGVDALEQYKLQQAEYAMYGTPQQQLAAAQADQEANDALFDEESRTTFGIDPRNVGDFDANYVRDLLSNPTFTDYLIKARNDIVKGKDPLDASESAGKDYAKATGDMLGATALAEMLASFDLAR